MIRVATVCTGVGAPEQAIKELGWNHEVVFGCEIDKYARETYRANFSPHSMYTDMTAEPWEGEKYQADVFVGGIPCQAFSIAGKRMGEMDPRGLLFYNFYDYVKKQQPKVFMIENVKGLLSDANGTTFQNWLQLLGNSVNYQHVMFPHPDSLGYNLHWDVLNSKDFGVPQNRERVFLIGIRNDLPNDFRFPKGFTLPVRLKHILESEVDQKYYLSDKMLDYLHTRKDNFNSGKVNYKMGDDVASCINASSGKLDISDNIIIDCFVNDKGTHRNVEHATCLDANYWKGMDNHAQRTMIRETYTGVTEMEMPVIRSAPRIRRLTPRECFRLQGFPDSYDISRVSDTQAYKQAGNSITVNVLKAIFKNIEYLFI
jgi:DNA (cytosine-5)-methyltransferase 1